MKKRHGICVEKYGGVFLKNCFNLILSESNEKSTKNRRFVERERKNFTQILWQFGELTQKDGKKFDRKWCSAIEIMMKK